MHRKPNTFRNQPRYTKTKEALKRWLEGETLLSIAQSFNVTQSIVTSRIQSFLSSIQTALRETDVMMTPELREVFTYPFRDGRSVGALRSNRQQLLLYVEILEGEQYVSRPGLHTPKKGSYGLDRIDVCPGCQQPFSPDAFTPNKSLCPICNKGLMQLRNILEARDG